jgi:hypothetical protein
MRIESAKKSRRTIASALVDRPAESFRAGGAATP